MLNPSDNDQLSRWVEERYRRALNQYAESGNCTSLGYALAMNDIAGHLPERETATESSAPTPVGAAITRSPDSTPSGLPGFESLERSRSTRHVRLPVGDSARTASRRRNDTLANQAPVGADDWRKNVN